MPVKLLETKVNVKVEINRYLGAPDAGNKNQKTTVNELVKKIKADFNHLTNAVSNKIVKQSYIQIIEDLTELNDARKNIFWHKTKPAGENALIIRDARQSKNIKNIRHNEAMLEQIVNLARASYFIVGTSAYKKIDSLVYTAMDNLLEKPNANAKEMKRYKLAFVDLVAEKSEPKLSKKDAAKRLGFTKDFMNFDHETRHITTISKVAGLTIVESDIALLGGRTDAQTQMYTDLKNQDWYSKMPEWKQKTINSYSDKLKNGTHIIPSQLTNSTIGIRNAYEKTTYTYDEDTSNLNSISEVFHHGNLSYDGKGDGGSIVDSNVKQLFGFMKEGKRPAVKPVVITLNTKGARTIGGENWIIKPTNAAVQNNGGAPANLAYNAWRWTSPGDKKSLVKCKLVDEKSKMSGLTGDGGDHLNARVTAEAVLNALHKGIPVSASCKSGKDRTGAILFDLVVQAIRKTRPNISPLEIAKAVSASGHAQFMPGFFGGGGSIGCHGMKEVSVSQYEAKLFTDEKMYIQSKAGFTKADIKAAEKAVKELLKEMMPKTAEQNKVKLDNRRKKIWKKVSRKPPVIKLTIKQHSDQYDPTKISVVKEKSITKEITKDQQKEISSAINDTKKTLKNYPNYSNENSTSLLGDIANPINITIDEEIADEFSNLEAIINSKVCSKESATSQNEIIDKIFEQARSGGRVYKRSHETLENGQKMVTYKGRSCEKIIWLDPKSKNITADGSKNITYYIDQETNNISVCYGSEVEDAAILIKATEHSNASVLSINPVCSVTKSLNAVEHFEGGQSEKYDPKKETQLPQQVMGR